MRSWDLDGEWGGLVGDERASEQVMEGSKGEGKGGGSDGEMTTRLDNLLALRSLGGFGI